MGLRQMTSPADLQGQAPGVTAVATHPSAEISGVHCIASQNIVVCIFWLAKITLVLAAAAEKEARLVSVGQE